MTYPDPDPLDDPCDQWDIRDTDHFVDQALDERNVR
ncbi:hypothetical protein ABH922_003040 [Rhodococcus sp. 27YEA15]